MKARAIVQLEADLRGYLKHRTALIPPEIDELVAQINRFTSAILQKGFRKAVAEFLTGSDVRLDRPFIEVCEAIIEYHLRIVKKTDRDLAGKSLFEAYLYVAGTQYAFDPPKQTRLTRTLRRLGVKGFAELFLSLHLFNVISIEIQDKVSAAMPNLRSFELYMLSIEAICRDIVTRAERITRAEPEQLWAAKVRRNIEERLLSW